MKYNFNNFNAEGWIREEKENTFPAGWSEDVRKSGVVVWGKDFTSYE